MTPVWGLSEGGRKTTGRDRAVLPRSVVYDPALTVSLPTALSVTSGINAIAHAVEALYAPDASPIVSLMARDGARALYAALPRVVDDPGALDARSDALFGAWLCGACLGATTMSLHHKLCHVLGGRGLPHAETHTVVLPHALAFNAPAAPDLVPALRSAWEVADPARALQDLAGRLGAPTSLRELGLSRDDLPGIVDEAVANPYANPRPVTAEAVAGLLEDAWDGRPVSLDG
jgi:maleylacetate reductase